MEDVQESSRWLTGAEIVAGVGAAVVGFCVTACGVATEAQHFAQSTDLQTVHATISQTGPLAREMVAAGIVVAGMGYVSMQNGIRRLIHRSVQ